MFAVRWQTGTTKIVAGAALHDLRPAVACEAIVRTSDILQYGMRPLSGMGGAPKVVFPAVVGHAFTAL